MNKKKIVKAKPRAIKGKSGKVLILSSTNADSNVELYYDKQILTSFSRTVFIDFVKAARNYLRDEQKKGKIILPR